MIRKILFNMNGHEVSILFAIITRIALVAACPDGYTSHQGACYKLLDVRASWAEARSYCQAIGGELATIDDVSEQRFIEGHLTSIKATIKTNEIWIGATDMLEEGTFIEPETLRALTYFNWISGQPDNVGGQHCIGLLSNHRYLWDDNNCNSKNQALCKIPEGGDSEEIFG